MSERKRAKTERAILHAAKVLYEKQGVDGVTFDEIAKAADVCRTTVFNHYASADDLQSALASAEVDDLLAHCRESGRSGLALVETLLEKLIDDTVRYPRVMARLTNEAVLGRVGVRVAEIERLIADQYEAEYGPFPPDAEPTAELLSQMTLGLYFGQVNHLLAHGLPFEAESMRCDMRAMLRCLLKTD